MFPDEATNAKFVMLEFNKSKKTKNKKQKKKPGMHNISKLPGMIELSLQNQKTFLTIVQKYTLNVMHNGTCNTAPLSQNAASAIQISCKLL